MGSACEAALSSRCAFTRAKRSAGPAGYCGLRQHGLQRLQQRQPEGREAGSAFAPGRLHEQTLEGAVTQFAKQHPPKKGSGVRVRI